MEWSKKQDESAGQKIEVKALQNLNIDGRIKKQLELLKIDGGPFISCGEIDEYLAMKDITEKPKPC